MRKVVMLNRIALDGMFASEGSANFGMDWFVHDPKVEEYVHTLGTPGEPSADTLLLGGTTYRGFEAAWLPMLGNPDAPPAMRAIAEELTQMRKVVFSSHIKESPWANTQLVQGSPAEVVRRLKTEPGAGIMVMGSGTVVRSLASEGLIDQYIFIMSPVLAGKGKPLFPGIVQQNLTLLSARTFESGNVVLHYQLRLP
jgi:dihydrofolate reductase